MKIKKILIIFIYLLINKIHLCAIDFNDIMSGIQTVKGLYDDFKTLTSKGNDFNIDNSLTDLERDNRYELMFTNYINSYSIKNNNMTSIDLDVFRDTYKNVIDGLVIYLKKDKAQLINDFKGLAVKGFVNKIGGIMQPGKNIAPSNNVVEVKASPDYFLMPSNYMLDRVSESLYIIQQKKIFKKNIILIEKFKNNISQLILDYEQDQENLKNKLKILINLEDEVSGLTDIEKKLFNSYAAQNEMSEKEQYDFFNIILTGDAIIEYKNNIYIEKKKSLDLISDKLIQLKNNIDVLIKKKNELLILDSQSYKKNIDNIFFDQSDWSDKNKKKKKILNKMDDIINGKKKKKQSYGKYGGFFSGR